MPGTHTHIEEAPLRLLDGEIYIGDCRKILEGFPPESFQLCVTSPPYWALKDYGIKPSAYGGDPSCLHTETADGDTCPECGAWVGVMGLEPTQEMYISHAADYLMCVHRVLKDTGTLWLNMGDTFAKKTSPWGSSEIKAREISGLPWRLALELSARGWYLRKDVIWLKPNAYPESVKDRPVKDFEYLFMFTKRGSGYYYDWETIREPQKESSIRRQKYSFKEDHGMNLIGSRHTMQKYYDKAKASGKVFKLRRRRSVWTEATKGYPVDKAVHSAVFPEGLIETCIRASSRKGDTVLDPFGGLGTTGLVSQKLGRRWTLIDVSEKYCSAAAERIIEKAGGLE